MPPGAACLVGHGHRWGSSSHVRVVSSTRGREMLPAVSCCQPGCALCPLVPRWQHCPAVPRHAQGTHSCAPMADPFRIQTRMGRAGAQSASVLPWLCQSLPRSWTRGSTFSPIFTQERATGLRSLGFLLGSFQQVRDKLCACIYQHAFLMYWKQVCSSRFLCIFISEIRIFFTTSCWCPVKT